MQKNDVSLEHDIAEFNNAPQYAFARVIYQKHFETIMRYIERSNPQSAIKDIKSLAPHLSTILRKTRFFENINQAILVGKLKKDDINIF